MNLLKYSSWNRLRRVTAWVRRFADLLLAKVKKQGKPVGVVARTYIDANWNRQRWRTVGETNTGGEISWRDKRFDWRKRSQKTEPLEISYPIVDELGILRVGGRLDRAELSYDAAHPMILPKKHHIKQLIVADVHNRCRHAGVNHVLAQVRNRCRIIDGRQEVKNKERTKKGQRMQGVWEKTCTAISVDHGTASKEESWNNDESVCKVLGWLRWPLHDQDYSKSFC